MNKVLIIYASKTGVTKDAARKIAGHLNAELHDCRGGVLTGPDGQVDNRMPSLNEYSAVILGTAMYVGAPLKEFKRFCAEHEKELLSLPIAVFTCGMETAETDEKYLRKQLPAFMQHAFSYRHLGGEVRSQGLSAFERMAMKQFEKQRGKAPGIDENALSGLCAAVTGIL